MQSEPTEFDSIKAHFAKRMETERNLGFEEGCVKRILKTAGIPLHMGKAHADAMATFRVETLTFLWFHHAFPTFPVRMGSAKLRNTSGTHYGWTDLFGASFAKLPWVKEYHEMAAQCGYDLREERVALVFAAPHADKSSTMVIHNQPITSLSTSPERREEPETRILRPHGKPRIVHVIESFDSFMATVGNDWASGLVSRVDD